MDDRAERSALVERGYDAVADRYATLERAGREWPRLRWLEKLLDGVPEGARVLDLGCGNGVPATQAMAQRFAATGVDVSRAQVQRARRNVPDAEFIHADLAAIGFPDGRFAAVAAFYVIDHLPREHHAALLERLHRWLAPGGRLLFTIEPYDEPGIVADWLGEPMFFSQYDADTTLGLVRDAGFEILESAVESQFEGDHDVAYLWVLARRP